MEGAKRLPLRTREKAKRKNRRLVRSIVVNLKSNAYLYAPLFSNFPPFPPQIQTPPPPESESSTADALPVAGFKAFGMERVKKNKSLSEKVKKYLKSDCHMYRPMISPLKPGSSLKGKLQVTNLVTMEVSTSTTTTRDDNINYRNLRSDIAEHTLHNGKISSPKRALVILEGQRAGLSRETDLSPARSSLRGKDSEARSKESSIE